MSKSIIPQCGIYIITCSANGKRYIGSSIDIARRWRQHKTALRNGKHENGHLQNAWNKYGEPSFVFSILQACEPDNIAKVEQYYLDAFLPFDKLGFNIDKDAITPLLGLKFTTERRANMSKAFKGRKVSETTRARISAGKLGIKIAKCSDDRRAKIQRTLTGLKKAPEHVEKMANTKRKSYVLTSPLGEEVQIFGLRRFCAVNDLDDGALIKVAKGKQRNHKGWLCRYA